MSDISYSAKLRELSKDYYQNHIRLSIKLMKSSMPEKSSIQKKSQKLMNLQTRNHQFLWRRSHFLKIMMWMN